MLPDISEAAFSGGKTMLSSIMFHELLLVSACIYRGKNMGTVKLMIPVPSVQSQALLSGPLAVSSPK